MKNSIITALSIVISLGVNGGCSEPHSKAQSIEYKPEINPDDFTTKITNKYFNLPVGKVFSYVADTKDGKEVIQIEILPETKMIMGVETLIYHDRVAINDELVEDTYDYLAMNKNDNSVWYFGEDVDNYEDGVIVDHDGSWIAGEDEAMPGIWIKGTHTVGDSYRQEYLKGEAEDMRDVLEIGLRLEVRGIVYKDCVKFLDWTPLDAESKEHKYNCPEAGGMVLEKHLIKNESTELVGMMNIDRNDSYNPTINPSDFTKNITNKFFTLPIGKKFKYESQTDNGLQTIEIEILNQTKTVMGVETLVYLDRVYLDGELIESTLDYLAQKKSDGSVWYFGENVDNYEEGVLVDHHGTWIGGENGALPGIWAKEAQTVGDFYRQEHLLGEAEDFRQVVAVNQKIKVGSKTYAGCVKFMDWTPLDISSLEHKYYCPETGGMAYEEHVVDGNTTSLVSVILP